MRIIFILGIMAIFISFSLQTQQNNNNIKLIILIFQIVTLLKSRLGYRL
jgi:hypothetical protein